MYLREMDVGSGGRSLPRGAGLLLLGVVLLAGGSLAIPYHFRGEPLPVLAFYLFMDVGLPAGFLMASVYLTRSDLTDGDLATVTRYTLLVVGICATLYLWSRFDDVATGVFANIYHDLALYSNLGAVGGLLLGSNRARAAQNTRLLERTTAQQETLEFVNHLLRHNVLNGLQVVDGYADLLAERLPPGDEDAARFLQVVEDRNQHMTDLVMNVRVLMRTLTDGVEEVPVDCSATVEHEVSVARAGHPDATFDVDLEPGLTVLADSTLGAVLENLLTNAVIHSDREHPRVQVSALRERIGSASEVLIRITDDGPGIPESLREVYVREGERGAGSSGDGLGLYLAATLVDAYGGSLHIGENEPRGAAFELRLPAAAVERRA